MQTTPSAFCLFASFFSLRASLSIFVSSEAASTEQHRLQSELRLSFFPKGGVLEGDTFCSASFLSYFLRSSFIPRDAPEGAFPSPILSDCSSFRVADSRETLAASALGHLLCFHRLFPALPLSLSLSLCLLSASIVFFLCPVRSFSALFLRLMSSRPGRRRRKSSSFLGMDVGRGWEVVGRVYRAHLVGGYSRRMEPLG